MIFCVPSRRQYGYFVKGQVAKPVPLAPKKINSKFHNLHLNGNSFHNLHPARNSFRNLHLVGKGSRNDQHRRDIVPELQSLA